jgi:hypothetical protein
MGLFQPALDQPPFASMGISQLFWAQEMPSSSPLLFKSKVFSQLSLRLVMLTSFQPLTKSMELFQSF